MAAVTIQVEGMTCGHCVKAVEAAVAEGGGQGKADLKTGLVQIEIENLASLDKIKQAIVETGYSVKSD